MCFRVVSVKAFVSCLFKESHCFLNSVVYIYSKVRISTGRDLKVVERSSALLRYNNGSLHVCCDNIT